MTAQLMRTIIERAGHEPVCVGDGRQAWARVQADREGFDAIVTDQRMPDLSGTQLVARLRAIRYPGKILVLSSALQPEEERALAELGVDAVLFKPGGLMQIVPTVEA